VTQDRGSGAADVGTAHMDASLKDRSGLRSKDQTLAGAWLRPGG
jgi:hypothetical protein